MNRRPPSIEPPVRVLARAPQRGFALLAALWLTTLLALVAASFTTTARTDIQLGRNAVARAEAEALADAGVYRAVLALLEPDPALRWRTDGTAYGLGFGAGTVFVSIQDEAGKVDLNVASDELLHGLFVAAAALEEDHAAALVDAVADFRDPDDLRRLNGLEDPDYHAAGLSYGAKDGPFEAVEELRQVPGMTPELYRRVAPLLTVHSWQPGVDPMTAPPGVLLALPGITLAQVEALLAARAEAAAGPEAEAQAEAFDEALGAEEPNGGGRWVAPARPSGRQRPMEQRRQQRASRVDDEPPRRAVRAVEPLLAGLEAFLSASDGSIFSVRAEAHGAGGGVFVREAIVALTLQPELPYRLHGWQRGESGPPPDQTAAP